MKTSTKSILGGRVEVIGPADCVGAVASHIETTISGPAAAVQPLKPALDDEKTPLTPQQALNNFRLFLELSPRNFHADYRAAVCEIARTCIELGIAGDDHHPDAPADAVQLRNTISRMAGLLAEAAGLADETAQWLTGGEGYEPQVLADALTKLAMDCREASNKVQSLKIVVEVRGGVAEVTTCPTGVECEIIDHDNEGR